MPHAIQETPTPRASPRGPIPAGAAFTLAMRAWLLACTTLWFGCGGRCIGQDNEPSTQIVFEKSVAVEGASTPLASGCETVDDGPPHITAAPGTRLVETISFVTSAKHPSTCPTPTGTAYYCSHDDEVSRTPATLLGDPTCLSVNGADSPVSLENAEPVGATKGTSALQGMRLTFVVKHPGTVILVDPTSCAPLSSGAPEFVIDAP